LVVAESGWQDYAAVPVSGAQKIVPGDAPLSTYLGIMGMPGLTAYAGMKRLAKPQAGETVVVSAASGPVGSMVGQICRINGCRVVGIAGSDEKCAFLTDELGFDAAINYKTEDLATALVEHCPDRIDVYFDNVGGDTLTAACGHLALHARVILCGLITQYNADKPPPGPNLGPVIGARAEMKGLVVYDHADLNPEFQRVAGRWLADGLLRYREDVTEGLATAPSSFARLMRGENFGKALVKIATDA
jgi:NADPH-dependent curcumin reductase CurA